MISTKGRYAIRLILDLAGQKGDGPTKLESIAERQGISKKYLESIVKILVSGGLVKGTSGKGGGYFLTRVPEEYTIYEILRLTEGSLHSVACLDSGAERCPRQDVCKTLPMWREFDDMVRKYFSHKTIKDLM